MDVYAESHEQAHFTERGRVLVVADETDFARGLCRLISSEFPDTECVYAGSGEEALAELTARGADLMITDLRMPGMDGISLLGRALELSPALAGVVLTAYGAIETAVDVRDQLVPARCEHLQVEVEVVLDGFGDVGLSVSAIQSPSHSVDVFGQGSFGCESGGVELQSFTGFEDFEHVLRRCTSLKCNFEF